MCTTVIASYLPVASASSIISAVIARPHSTFSSSACLPLASATLNQRSENAPCMQQSTRSRTQLRIAASHTPVEDELNRNTRPFVSSSCFSLGTTRW